MGLLCSVGYDKEINIFYYSTKQSKSPRTLPTTWTYRLLGLRYSTVSQREEGIFYFNANRHSKEGLVPSAPYMSSLSSAPRTAKEAQFCRKHVGHSYPVIAGDVTNGEKKTKALSSTNLEDRNPNILLVHALKWRFRVTRWKQTKWDMLSTWNISLDISPWGQKG